MSQQHQLQDATGIYMNNPGQGPVFMQGDTVPTDGDAGYAVGCIFIDTGGGVGTTLYVNEGSTTSCDFNAK